MSNTDNQIDHAAEVVSRLSKDYAELRNSVASTLEKMRALPKDVSDEATLDSYAIVIREARDLNKRLDAYHDAEKTPYLRAGQGVDQFFFGMMEKLAKRKKGDPNGGIDVLDIRVDAYMQEKLRIEREARERVAAEERRKADEIRRQQEAAAASARDAELKAARARNADNIAAHEAEAARQRQIAEDARRQQELADQQAEDAQIDTKASAADMVRTRTESGAIGTMGTVPFVEIDDVTKLDKEMLWPFLKEEHVLMALKAWAKTKSHKTAMAGATIELRNKGQVR